MNPSELREELEEKLFFPLGRIIREDFNSASLGEFRGFVLRRGIPERITFQADFTDYYGHLLEEHFKWSFGSLLPQLEEEKIYPIYFGDIIFSKGKTYSVSPWGNMLIRKGDEALTEIDFMAEWVKDKTRYPILFEVTTWKHRKDKNIGRKINNLKGLVGQRPIFSCDVLYGQEDLDFLDVDYTRYPLHSRINAGRKQELIDLVDEIRINDQKI